MVGIGGQLSPAWILDAYRHGIFPWPVSDDPEMLAWWSLDPRAIIEFDDFHVSRRLARTCRSGRFTVTCNVDFRGVVRACATVGNRKQATWITPDIYRAYARLHDLGHAHSIEAWCAGRLAGGVYGLALGGLFAAESMFHRVRDASKVALAAMVEHLRRQGFVLLDIQQLTEHTSRFGASEITREEYLRRLAKALETPANFGTQLQCDWLASQPADGSTGLPSVP